MFGLKKFLFRQAAPDHLPDDVKLALSAWGASAAPALDEAHFHTRYVLLDIATTGNNPETDDVLVISALSVYRNAIRTDDACFVDLSSEDDAATVARKLAAFLSFVGKSPVVTYHVPFVGRFLQRLFKDQLGLAFAPQWVDLAWLLPSMFEERGHQVMPLDFWIENFGLDATNERRDPMANTLLLARIFQMAVTRALTKDIATAARLVDESRASSFLRRTH